MVEAFPPFVIVTNFTTPLPNKTVSHHWRVHCTLFYTTTSVLCRFPVCVCKTKPLPFTPLTLSFTSSCIACYLCCFLLAQFAGSPLLDLLLAGFLPSASPAGLVSPYGCLFFWLPMSALIANTTCRKTLKALLSHSLYFALLLLLFAFFRPSFKALFFHIHKAGRVLQ